MKEVKYKSYDDLPLMLSVPEVAAVLRISRAGAYELVHSKGFPSLTIGSRIVVPKEKFIAWIDEKSSDNSK
jgi:excisionase family DNA binding protein